MSETVAAGRTVTISIEKRRDAPGYFVEAVMDEKTAKIPVRTYRDGIEMARCCRESFTRFGRIPVCRLARSSSRIE